MYVFLETVDGKCRFPQIHGPELCLIMSVCTLRAILPKCAIVCFATIVS